MTDHETPAESPVPDTAPGAQDASAPGTEPAASLPATAGATTDGDPGLDVREVVPAEAPGGPEAGIEDSEDEATDGAGDGARRGSGRRARAAQLEREGEVAADYLETLLDIADLDGDIDVDIDGDRASIAVVDSEEGRVPRRLVGQDGKVLEALQELTRMAVQAETGERSRLMLDVAGHRADRREAIVAAVRQAVAEVERTGRAAPLEPMSAFERKVAHDAVLAAGLHSESEGVDPGRHVVVLPAQAE